MAKDTEKAGRAGAAADAWVLAINGAQTEAELIAVVKDYLATWSLTDLSRIPRACRPGTIRTSDELVGVALKLTRAHLKYDASGPGPSHLDRMATFFTQASARLAQILTPRAPTILDPLRVQ